MHSLRGPQGQNKTTLRGNWHKYKQTSFSRDHEVDKLVHSTSYQKIGIGLKLQLELAGQFFCKLIENWQLVGICTNQELVGLGAVELPYAEFIFLGEGWKQRYDEHE